MGDFVWASCMPRGVSAPAELADGVAGCWRTLADGVSTGGEPAAALSALPLSNPVTWACVIGVYLCVVGALHLKTRGGNGLAIGRTRLFVACGVVHNLVLSLGSLWMNVLAVRAAAAAGTVDDADGSQYWSFARTVCVERGDRLHPALQRAIYIFLVSKAYELLDTVLLLVRGRPATTLHVWHHASVAFEAWSWLQYDVGVGLYGMWFNTFVHVVMYAYYAAALVGWRIGVKQLITATQIIQFLTGFATLIPFVMLHLRKAGGACEGVQGLVVSSVINGSYLVLFIDFYRRTYLMKKGRRGRKENSKES